MLQFCYKSKLKSVYQPINVKENLSPLSPAPRSYEVLIIITDRLHYPFRRFRGVGCVVFVFTYSARNCRVLYHRNHNHFLPLTPSATFTIREIVFLGDKGYEVMYVWIISRLKAFMKPKYAQNSLFAGWMLTKLSGKLPNHFRGIFYPIYTVRQGCIRLRVGGWTMYTRLNKWQLAEPPGSTIFDWYTYYHVLYEYRTLFFFVRDWAASDPILASGHRLK